MGEWTRDTPWLQGHILRKADTGHLGLCLPDFPDSTVALVISHDCDLAQLPHAEPDVELIVGHTIEKPNGNHTFAKDSRKLHVQFVGETPFYAEFTMTNRRLIPKEVLQGYLPDLTTYLESANRKNLQRWLASRYHRPAFPNEFDNRIKYQTKVAEKLKDLAKKDGKNIQMFLFDVQEIENDVFPLGIQVVYTNGDDPIRDFTEAKTICQKIQELFESNFYNKKTDSWNLIELLFCDPISDENLTYKQFSELQRWNLDYVSADPAKPQKIPVE
jgi:hypothetical protein